MRIQNEHKPTAHCAGKRQLVIVWIRLVEKESARFLARSQPTRTKVNTFKYQEPMSTQIKTSQVLSASNGLSNQVNIGFSFECEWSSKKRTSSRDQSRSKLRPKQSELLSTLIWTVLPLKIVDRNPEFHFNITTLCDWSWKLAPFSQPMRCIFFLPAFSHDQIWN